jgi:hypothetical protein
VTTDQLKEWIDMVNKDINDAWRRMPDLSLRPAERRELRKSIDAQIDKLKELLDEYEQRLNAGI